MSDIKIGALKTLDFPCEPWRVEGEDMMNFRIGAVPGTWTLAPEFFLKRGIRALIACPNCNQAALIRHDMGEIINGVNHLAAFRCASCGLTANLRLQHWDKRKLFCIAYEALDSKTGEVIPDRKGEFVRKEYTHAETREEAFRCFVEVRKVLGRFRVIDVGEVIGFFGLESDKDQKELTV